MRIIYYFIKDKIWIQISCVPSVISTPIWTSRPRRFGQKTLFEASCLSVDPFLVSQKKAKPHKMLFASWALCCLLFMMPNYGFLIQGINTSVLFLSKFISICCVLLRQVLSHLLLTVTMICPRELPLPWNMRK